MPGDAAALRVFWWICALPAPGDSFVLVTPSFGVPQNLPGAAEDIREAAGWGGLRGGGVREGDG